MDKCNDIRYVFNHVRRVQIKYSAMSAGQALISGSWSYDKIIKRPTLNLDVHALAIAAGGIFQKAAHMKYKNSFQVYVATPVRFPKKGVG